MRDCLGGLALHFDDSEDEVTSDGHTTGILFSILYVAEIAPLSLLWNGQGYHATQVYRVLQAAL